MLNIRMEFAMHIGARAMAYIRGKDIHILPSIHQTLMCDIA